MVRTAKNISRKYVSFSYSNFQDYFNPEDHTTSSQDYNNLGNHIASCQDFFNPEDHTAKCVDNPKFYTINGNFILQTYILHITFLSFTLLISLFHSFIYLFIHSYYIY